MTPFAEQRNIQRVSNRNPTNERIHVNQNNSECKPPFTYAQLIVQVLMTKPKMEATLSEIYTGISKKYPFFKLEETGWKNSVRHNLSTYGSFKRREASCSEIFTKNEPYRFGYWFIEPDKVNDLVKNAYVLKKAIKTPIEPVTTSRRTSRVRSSVKNINPYRNNVVENAINPDSTFVDASRMNDFQSLNNCVQFPFDHNPYPVVDPALYAMYQLKEYEAMMYLMNYANAYCLPTWPFPYAENYQNFVPPIPNAVFQGELDTNSTPAPPTGLPSTPSSVSPLAKSTVLPPTPYTVCPPAKSTVLSSVSSTISSPTQSRVLPPLRTIGSTPITIVSKGNIATYRDLEELEVDKTSSKFTNQVISEPANKVLLKPTCKAVPKHANKVVPEPANKISRKRAGKVLRTSNKVVSEPENKVMLKPATEVVPKLASKVVKTAKKVVPKRGKKALLETSNKVVLNDENKVILEPASKVFKNANNVFETANKADSDSSHEVDAVENLDNAYPSLRPAEGKSFLNDSTSNETEAEEAPPYKDYCIFNACKDFPKEATEYMMRNFEYYCPELRFEKQITKRDFTKEDYENIDYSSDFVRVLRKYVKGDVINW